MNQRDLCKAYAEDFDCHIVANACALSVAKADCFSYATLIVHKYEWMYHGRHVAWMTNLRFSITTSKHCTFLRGALGRRNYVVVTSPEHPAQEDEQSIMRLCDLLDKELAKQS